MPSATFKIIVSPHAVTDLDRIFTFIAQDKPVSAKRFVAGLYKKMKELRTFPRRGSLIRTISQEEGEFRYLTHKGYLIFYEIRDKKVRILQVSAPGEDWLGLYL